MRATALEVCKLAYVAKQTYEIGASPQPDAFYAICRAVCSDVDFAIYTDLVLGDRVVDEADFWHSRAHVVQGVHQMLVNLDGRTGGSRAYELLRRQAQYGERIHVRLDLMAAFFVDDPTLEREWHAGGSANGETAARFWRRTLGACAHRLWAREGRAVRALAAVDAGTIVDVAVGRFGQVSDDEASRPGKRSGERSRFSDELKKT